eukprot:g26425.t1
MFQDQELASVVEKFTAGLHVPKTDDENAFQEAKRKAIVKKILGILKEDSSGSTEWDEFLEFFRKAECLLEYRSEKARNRTALHEEVEALRSRQHDDPPEVEKDIRQKASNVGRRAIWPEGSRWVLGALLSQLSAVLTTLGYVFTRRAFTKGCKRAEPEPVATSVAERLYASCPCLERFSCAGPGGVLD